MHKRYCVTLTVEERAELDRLIIQGKAAARTLGHARMLLLTDAAAGGPAWTDAQVAEAVRVHVLRAAPERVGTGRGLRR